MTEILLKKDQSKYLFLLALIPFSIGGFLLVTNLYEQIMLAIFFFILFILARFIPKFHKNQSQISPIVKIALYFPFFIAIALLWNIIYFFYLRHFHFQQDIFREPVQTLHAPLYGLSQTPLHPFYLVTLVSVILSVVMILFFFSKNDFKYSLSAAAVLQLILITGFCFSDGISRWEINSVHFNTYSEGIRFFKDIPDLLLYYIPTMGQMGEHNNHYPPGNLIILWLEKNYGLTGLTLSVNIAAVLLTLPIIRNTARNLNLNQGQVIFTLLLSIISANIIIFCTIDFSAIPMLLFTLSINFFLIYLKKKEPIFLILLALTIWIFSFFSFTVSLLLLFMAIYSLMLIINKKVRFLDVMWSFTYLSLFFVAGYIILWITTDFNWLFCFLKAVKLNHELMKSNGFDNLARYLIRGSGNLTGFILGTGITGVVFISGMINRTKNLKGEKITASFFSSAFLITLLLISFSGLFFLETERIWLCFVPVMAISAAACFPIISILQRNLLIISGIFTACILELFWCQI